MYQIYIITVLSLSVLSVISGPLRLFDDNAKEISVKDCRRCKQLGEAIQHVLQQPQSPECVAAVFTDLCLKLGLYTSDVCIGMANEYSVSIEYSLQYNLLNPYDFCGTFFGDTCSNGSIIADWHVAIPGNKPPVQIPTQPPPNSRTYRVVHLSDIHYDKYYQPGTEANCDEPLCCRSQFGPGKNITAGYWGTPAKCDMPLRTINNLFDHLKTNETWDWMIWTGDMPPHDIWNQTKDGQMDVLDTIYGALYDFMWDKQVYLAVGNHESAPCNSFPPRNPNVPPEDSVQWLYDYLAYNWSHWVSDVGGTQRDIKQIASYVTQIMPKLRLISLNTQYCIEGNFWLYANQTDPDGSLAWLIKQLQSAEDAGDKVHIIGHAPSGDHTCLRMWSANYYDIINRYESTVVGQFFGHTHSDQFILFYENGKFSGRPTNVMYVAPSVTTFSWRMPTYRVYTIDSISFEVLETETYMLNLTEANLTNKTEWKLEYNATEAYGLTSLFPSDWNNVLNHFIKDEMFFDETYYRYFDRNDKQCDEKCYFTRLCEIRSGRSHDKEDLCFDLPYYDNRTIVLADEEHETILFEIPDQCKLDRTSTMTTTTKGDHTSTMTTTTKGEQTSIMTTTTKGEQTSIMTTTTKGEQTSIMTTTTKGANQLSSCSFIISLFITVLLLNI